MLNCKCIGTKSSHAQMYQFTMLILEMVAWPMKIIFVCVSSLHCDRIEKCPESSIESSIWMWYLVFHYVNTIYYYIILYWNISWIGFSVRCIASNYFFLFLFFQFHFLVNSSLFIDDHQRLSRNTFINIYGWAIVYEKSMCLFCVCFVLFRSFHIFFSSHLFWTNSISVRKCMNSITIQYQ